MSPNPLGYARVVNAERYADGRDANDRIVFITLEAGEEVKVLQPNNYERERLAEMVHPEKAWRPTPHTVIEWRGMRRFIPTASLRFR